MANSNNYSFGSFVSFIANNFVVLLIAGLFAVGGFTGGSLYTENKMLKGGVVAGTSTGGSDAAIPDDLGDTGPTEAQLAEVPEVSKDDYVRGNSKAKVSLVEYSDFECPFCQRFHPTMQQVMEEYGDKVSWVYRHYPLPFHPNAQKAAEASECIAQQGGNEAFWKYADAIFKKNEELGGQISPDAIQSAAESSGVNMDKFKECLDSGKMADIVTADMDSGSNSGVSGTPGTFIVVDGEAKELIPGALPFEQVKTMIDQYL